MSTIFYDTTFDALIDTLADYYGTSSIGWQEVSDAGFTNEAIIDSINGIPGYHAVQNSDGTVRMYVQSKTYGTVSNATASTSGANSNVQTGTNSAGNSATITAPADSEYTSEGTFEATKGLNETTSSQFTVAAAAGPIIAVGTALMLGKTIDRTLYNLNPDFWDEHDMENLDPDTWSTITCDMTGSWGETALATAFNMLFGINPNIGRVQPYIDEEAFAYMAMYMQRKGVFNSGGVNPQQDGIILSNGFDRAGPQLTRIQVTNIYANTGWFDTSAGVKYTLLDDGNQIVLVSASETRNDNVTVWTRESGGGQYFQQRTSIECTYNNRTFYYNSGAFDNGNHQPMWVTLPVTISDYPSLINTPGITLPEAIAYMLLYGSSSPTIEGIGNQTGATLPILNNNMDMMDVLNALKSQYPNIWNQKEENHVAQPDGSVRTYVYIPVAVPEAQSRTDPQPTGDGETTSQAKPYFEWDTSTGDYNQQAWDSYYRIPIDPFDPVFPEDPEDDDDAGDGDTPTPIVPDGSASALWKIYNPSQAQLDAFGAWLWSSDFVDQLLKVFNDPMQAIIGLHKIFVSPPVSGSGAIKVGYLTSTASANYVNGQYVTVDCGSITLYEYFGNVLDYENTQVSVYLPFSGIHKLDIDDVMRSTIKVVYHVDVLTGACLIELNVRRDNAGGVLYTFSGNCAVQYPVSSGSYVGIVTGLLGIAGGIAGTVASGGALAPALMGTGAAIGSMHTDVQHSGNISSNAGAICIKKPYLIIERAQAKIPVNGYNIEGIPENDIITLSTITGHAKVKKARYDNIPATEPEIEQIKALLESGVYIN